MLPEEPQFPLFSLLMPQILLLFPETFWGTAYDMFGRVGEGRADRGEAFLFYSCAHISGGALLIALCAGKLAVPVSVGEPAFTLLTKAISQAPRGGLACQNPSASTASALPLLYWWEAPAPAQSRLGRAAEWARSAWLLRPSSLVQARLPSMWSPALWARWLRA